MNRKSTRVVVPKVRSIKSKHIQLKGSAIDDLRRKPKDDLTHHPPYCTNGLANNEFNLCCLS